MTCLSMASPFLSRHQVQKMLLGALNNLHSCTRTDEACLLRIAGSHWTTVIVLRTSWSLTQAHQTKLADTEATVVQQVGFACLAEACLALSSALRL